MSTYSTRSIGDDGHGEPSMNALAYVPLADLLPMPTARNPRGGHRIGPLAASIRQHGFGQAVTVNRTTGRVLAGNGRMKAIGAMHRHGEPAPVGITLDDAGRWLVPTLYGDWPEADEGRVALALNGGLAGSLEGGWNDQAIADLLRQAAALDLDALGIGDAQAAQFIADHDAPTVPPQINLEGLESLPEAAGQSTVRLVVTEDLAGRVRRLSARGVPAEEILTRGIDRIEAADRKASPPAAKKTRRAAAVREG